MTARGPCPQSNDTFFFQVGEGGGKNAAETLEGGGNVLFCLFCVATEKQGSANPASLSSEGSVSA